jgi:predicted CopG family antitoxin
VSNEGRNEVRLSRVEAILAAVGPFRRALAADRANGRYNLCTQVHYLELAMAVKTITIDMEAYERLRSVRKANESFSQTIKRVVQKPFDLDAWLKRVGDNPLSPKTVKAIEQEVKNRRKPINREGRRAVS